MSTVNNFTRGNFEIDSYGKLSNKGETISLSGVSLNMGKCCKSESNTELLCASLNSATKLSEMGYDAVSLIEALPKIVELIGCGGELLSDIDIGVIDSIVDKTRVK